MMPTQPHTVTIPAQAQVAMTPRPSSSTTAPMHPVTPHPVTIPAQAQVAPGPERLPNASMHPTAPHGFLAAMPTLPQQPQVVQVEHWDL